MKTQLDIRQSITNRHGELDEPALHRYKDALMEEFRACPEFTAMTQGDGYLVDCMIELGAQYLSVSPAGMTTADFEEVLFTLIPRKISCNADGAAAAIEGLRAFWSFAARAYNLENAAEMLRILDQQAEKRLHRALSNPANFGMAKSFMMQGRAAGYDMTNQEDVNKFIVEYNARVLSSPALPAFDVPGLRLVDNPYPFAAPRSQGARRVTKQRRKMQKTSRRANRQR